MQKDSNEFYERISKKIFRDILVKDSPEISLRVLWDSQEELRELPIDLANLKNLENGAKRRLAPDIMLPSS